MIYRKNKKHSHLLIVGIIFTLFLFFLFCSRRISFEKLKMKNGEYYQGADEQPFTGKAVKRYKSGRIKAEYRIENGKFHGPAVMWYPDGNKKMELDYQQGKKHGESHGWFSTGSKRFVYRFKENKIEGKSICWYKNGQRKTEADYKEGKLYGKWNTWYENGQKKEETQFKNDIEYGTKVQWYTNGQKKFQGCFSQGNYHGTVTAWTGTGNKKFEKSFKNGKPHGKWQIWYANGKPAIRLQFENGEYDGLLIGWYENGNKKFERNARRGKPIGTWKRWYPDSTIRNSGEWKNGNLHGKWTEWYNNKSKKEEIIYNEGQKLEIYQWYPNGKKRLAAQWQNPTQTWNWLYWNKDGTKLTDKNRPFLRGLYPYFFASTNRDPGNSRDSQLTARESPPVTPLTDAQRQSLDTLQKIHDYSVYVMNYQGGYELDSFLLEGAPGYDQGLIDLSAYKKEDRCSTFVAHNPKEQILFAHNWDYKQYPYLILFTRPPHSYASISVVDVLGMSNISDNLHLARYKTGTTYLRAPYYPLEGMNECGVAVACMYVPGEFVGNPARVTVNMYQIIRIVLDYARDMDEAVDLFRNYNNSDSRSVHYLVADASGRSAVIEYMEVDIVVTPNTKPWQVSTNSLITGCTDETLRQECPRYDIAYGALEQANGRITWQQAMNILNNISMTGTPETISSTVYNLTTGQLFLAIGRDYRQVKEFKLNKNKISKKEDIQK
jgi:antitoxin component YwqK of YwqJK toxin-antitoxin module